VHMADGSVEYHEVKGNHRWREKGELKLAYAADMFPDCKFVLVKRVKGGWVEIIV